MPVKPCALRHTGQEPVPLNPVVPVSVSMHDPDEAVAAIREMRHRYGLRRFLVTGPSKTVRLVGIPDVPLYRQLGETIREVKLALAGEDVEIGWWCTTTIKSGDGPFTRVTDVFGKTCPISSCPLDPGFVERFSSCVAAAAEIAQPVLILFEDDFQLAGHPGIAFGCFCDRHLAAFAELTGRRHTRGELAELFGTVTPESIRLRRRYAEFGGGTLAGLAAAVSARVAHVAPGSRLGLCQDGSWARDGNATERLSRAFAGRHRPWVRIYGSYYGADTPLDLPLVMFQSLYSRQHLPSDIEFFQETDTYPHTRYFASAVRIEAQLTLAMMYGLDDSLYYATQHLPDPLEERAYAERFHQCASRFAVLRAAAAGTRLAGPEIVSHPEAHTAIPCREGSRNFHVPSAWAAALGRLGIPYTTAGGTVKLLAGEATARVLDDADVERLLAGPAMLDGGAAAVLLERGFGDRLGIAADPGDYPGPMRERIEPLPDLGNLAHTQLYNMLAFPAGNERVGGGYRNFLALAGAEVVTRFVSAPQAPEPAGIIRFQNPAGGRVVVLARDVLNESSNLFCYRKQHLLRRLLAWLDQAPLIAAVEGMPNVSLTANLSADGGVLMLTIISLGCDPAQEVRLEVAPGYAGAEVELLDEAAWIPATVDWHGNTLNLKTSLAIFKPVIVRLIKNTRHP